MNRVVSGTTDGPLDVGPNVVALAGLAVIGHRADADEQGGCAALVVHRVMPVAAVDRIPAGATVDRVVAQAAIEVVVARASVDEHRDVDACRAGGERMFFYGDTVNLAARLEAHTKVAGCPVLIDQATQLRSLVRQREQGQPIPAAAGTTPVSLSRSV